jgi:phosphoribosylaminoimidazole (AIR) synthetase
VKNKLIAWFISRAVHPKTTAAGAAAVAFCVFSWVTNPETLKDQETWAMFFVGVGLIVATDTQKKDIESVKVGDLYKRFKEQKEEKK